MTAVTNAVDTPRSVTPMTWRDPALSGRLGLIRHALVQRTRADEPPWPMALVNAWTADGAVASGAGINTTSEGAILAAVGEAVERYCMRAIPSGLAWSRASDLSGRVLGPGSWPMFTDEQYAYREFPYRRFDDDERHWTTARSLTTDETVWIPASLVWLRDEWPEGKLTAGLSTGSASHPLLEQAQVTSLYEAIQGDAVSISWESRATVPKLDPLAPWQAPTVVEAARNAALAGVDLVLRDITTDLGVPAVIAVLHDRRGRRPALAVGSACRATIKAACEKATLEAVHALSWMRDEFFLRPDCDYDTALAEAARPDDMVAHGFLYGFAEAVENAAHLVGDEPKREPAHPHGFEGPLTSPRVELDAIVRRLVESGLDPLWVDLTTRDVAPMGFRACRAVVPGLVHLSVGRWSRHLGNPRIAAVPNRVGWPHEGSLRYDAGLPHPLS